LPGTLAPKNQALAFRPSSYMTVLRPAASTSAAHHSSDSGVASSWIPCWSANWIARVTHWAPNWMGTGRLLYGVWGPIDMKKFGKPWTEIPRFVRMPSAHFSRM